MSSSAVVVAMIRAGLLPDPPPLNTTGEGGTGAATSHDEPDLIELVIRGDYLTVLCTPIAQAILKPVKSVKSADPGGEGAAAGPLWLPVVDGMVHTIAQYLNDGASLDVEARTQRETGVLAIGVAALQLFVQANWTGPDVDVAMADLVAPFRTDFVPFVPPVLEAGSATPTTGVGAAAFDAESHAAQFAAAGLLRQPVPRALEELSVDGEVAYRHTKVPEILCLARAVLCRPSTDGGVGSVAWSCRVAFAHQSMFDNPSATLHDEIIPPLIAHIASSDPVATAASISPDYHARLYLELGNYHAHYREPYRAQEAWFAAQTVLGLGIELTGALGVRTKFQQHQIAQLTLAVKHGNTAIREFPPADIPSPVNMNDDTRLEGIHFETSQADAALSITEQAVVLALCANVKNQNPKHGLTTEEMHPYLNCVKAYPRDWSVQLRALWVTSRIELEAGDMRARPRAIEQLLKLTQLASQPAPSAAWRLQNFWAVRTRPRWQAERELADANLALGCTRDALDVFERWEIWDGMIDCYTRLDFDGKADALVRERLKVETGLAAGTLWCVLGDLHDEANHYRKAWEVSGGKSARSQSSLGSLLVRRAETKIGLGPTAESRREVEGVGQTVKSLEADYREAMAAFQNAVRLNRMLSSVWFKLGCTALRVEDWPTAATAFRARVDLDQEDYEAWNNLSNAYIKMGKKRKAFYALREAVKNEYNNWKIWENFVVVAIDVGAFPDVVRAINRLIDLKKSYDDGEILQILVNVTTHDDYLDMDGRKASLLLRQVAELVDRVKSNSTLSAASWTAMATFHKRTGDAEKALLCCRSAYQAAKSVKEWERNDRRVAAVVDSISALAEAAQTAPEKKKALSTAKLLASSTVKMLSTAIDKGVAAKGATDAKEQVEVIVLDLEAALA